MGKFKSLLDPNQILNPYKLLPEKNRLYLPGHGHNQQSSAVTRLVAVSVNHTNVVLACAATCLLVLCQVVVMEIATGGRMAGSCHISTFSCHLESRSFSGGQLGQTTCTTWTAAHSQPPSEIAAVFSLKPPCCALCTSILGNVRGKQMVRFFVVCVNTQ